MLNTHPLNAFMERTSILFWGRSGHLVHDAMRLTDARQGRSCLSRTDGGPHSPFLRAAEASDCAAFSRATLSVCRRPLSVTRSSRREAAADRGAEEEVAAEGEAREADEEDLTVRQALVNFKGRSSVSPAFRFELLILL